MSHGDSSTSVGESSFSAQHEHTRGRRDGQPSLDVRRADSTHRQLQYFRNEDVGHFFTQRDLNAMEEVSVTLEEPWSDVTESTIRNWKAEAERAASGHQSAGYRLKFKHRLMSFLLLAWSGVTLVVNGLLGCNAADEGRITTLFVNAVQVFMAGLNNSMNLGYTYRVHFEYEAKYTELALDIEYMLSRSVSFRVPADQFMTEARERKKRLAEAPEIPKSRFFFC